MTDISVSHVTQSSTFQNRVQTQNQARTSTGDSIDFGNDYNVEIGSGSTEHQTYNSKAEFGAAVVSRTLDMMNSNPSSGYGNAQQSSYQFNKEVLGAYLS